MRVLKRIVEGIEWYVFHYILNVCLAMKHLAIAIFRFFHAVVPVKETDPDYLEMDND